MNWIFILFSYASLVVLGLSDNIRGPLFQQIMNQFHLNNKMGALFFAVTSACGFIGSYFADHVLKYMDRIRGLQMSLLLMTIGLAGIGLSQQYLSVLVFAALFGMSMGTMGVLQNVLVTIGSTSEKRNQMLSGLHAMYGGASLVAPIVVSVVMTTTHNWRIVFFLASGVAFVCLLASVWIKEKSHRSLSIHEHKKNGRFPIKEWHLAMAMGFYVVAEIMVASRLALFLQLKHHYDITSASLYVSLFFVGLLIGRILFTLKNFVKNIKTALNVSLTLSAVMILLGLYYHPYFLVLSGLMMSIFYPISISYISQVFPLTIDYAIGISVAVQSLLIVLMHLVVGYVTDKVGITEALLMGPLFLVISLVFLNTLRVKDRVNNQPHTT